MKILFSVHQFYPESWSGSETVTLRLASMMQKFGHRVTVLTYSFQKEEGFDKDIKGILVKEYSYSGVRVVALKHSNGPAAIDSNIGDPKLTDIADRILMCETPDIIHAIHSMRINELLFSALKLKIPYMLTLTDFWYICPRFTFVNSKGVLCLGPENGQKCAKNCPEFGTGYIVNRLKSAKKILTGAQRIISPSNFLADNFRKEFSDLEIQVINHGMRSNNIHTNKRVYKSGDEVVFGFAAFFSPLKGLHILIEALKRTSSEKVKLKIFGGGADRLYSEKLKEMVKNEKRIEFCGVYLSSQTGEIFNQLDVMVVPSICYENYPLTLHEALACNLPVITSNIGGMAEAVKDGFNGFTFQVGDIESLKSVMEKIINNPAVLNNMKSNLKNSFSNTIEQEACAYDTLYFNVLQNSPVTPDEPEK
jgi:glycosyltransferase involved in cell wall biosynthesis